MARDPRSEDQQTEGNDIMANKSEVNDQQSQQLLKVISGDPKIKLSTSGGLPALTLTFTGSGWNVTNSSGGIVQPDSGTEDTYSISATAAKPHYCMVYWEWAAPSLPDTRLWQSAKKISSGAGVTVTIYGAANGVFSLREYLEPIRTAYIKTNYGTTQYLKVSATTGRSVNLVTDSAGGTPGTNNEFGIISFGSTCVFFSEATSGVIYSTSTLSGLQIKVGFPTPAELDKTASPYPCQAWVYNQTGDQSFSAASNVGMVWNVQGGSNGNSGTSIQTYTRGASASSNEKWTLVKVS
jgi:hypothetical protein